MFFFLAKHSEENKMLKKIATLCFHFLFAHDDRLVLQKPSENKTK